MNILLVRSGGLGDAVLTLPVIHRIKELNPEARLHVLGNETVLAVMRRTGLGDVFHSLDTGRFSGIYSDAEPSKFLKSFFSDFHTVYFFTAANKEKIEHFIKEAGVKSCRVLDPRLPPDRHGHIVYHLMSILEDSHLPSSHPFFPVIKCEHMPAKKRNGLLIHPGSGSHSKNWPLERFIHLADKLDVPATFLMGPAEIECGMENDIPVNRFKVVITESLDELYNMLCGSKIYIGNDSGVSHCASLCDTPSLVLFGPTDPAIWRPLGLNVRVISSFNGTMEGISTRKVIEALKKTIFAN